jgi:alanyl-tRNA synthetase
MTDRLYYTDPYLRSFDAVVASVKPSAATNRVVVVLDRTAFYPTSGGQPFDTGTLAGFPVVDVEDAPDGAVAHVVEAAADALAVGQRVHGEIDWTRRFDHMQQHSGQHVLSAAFEHLFHIRTVSFHLGSGTSTIDLAREASVAEIAAAEDAANRVVWEDRPVAIRSVTEEEAAHLRLRKEPTREGTLRLIDVEGFDLSACGGTHVARTGAIGVIAVSSWERFKGGQRLEFVCGRRALDRLRHLRDVMAASVRLLSVLPHELPSAVARLQDEMKTQKRAMTGLQAEVARGRAGELVASAELMPLGRLVARAIEADAATLRALASAIVASPGHVAVLVSSSSPAFAVVARASDVNLDARALLGRLAAGFGGRGGGSPELAQGGGFVGPADAILDAARRDLSTRQ